jgi:hypothetical protein
MQQPLGADNANLTLSFNELANNYRPDRADQDPLRPSSGSSDDFFINNSSSKEEYDSYLSETPISGDVQKVSLLFSYRK